MIKKIVSIELALLVLILPITLFTLFREYRSLPGPMQTVEVQKRTADSIRLNWPAVRNAETYTVSYKEKDSDEWNDLEIPAEKTEAVIPNLKEGTDYEISLRASSSEKEGKTTAETNAATKKRQEITGKTKQQKLAGQGTLNLESETELKFSAADESVAKVSEEQLEFSPGTTVITAEAQESEEYVGETAEIEVEVLDSVYEDSSSADIHIISRIKDSDCERILTITDGVPQSFDKNGSAYVVTFGDRKAISYGEEKNNFTTGISLGHANGFAFANGKGYSVRGRSTECVVCDFDNGKYDSFSLPYGASGIAYDSARNMFYTSSVTSIVSYTEGFQTDKVITPVRHRGSFYAQDCGAHAGILMHCLSDGSKHGINFIDLYDMINGKYLGTIECDLNEVESATVDNEGYMLLLCNNPDQKDYIYKTRFNIDDLGSGLHSPN